MHTCPTCGRTGTLSGDVLTFVRQNGPVRADEVAQHFGVPGWQANRALCHLADRGFVTRVRRGVYSGDRELRRQALLDELHRLAPA